MSKNNVIGKCALCKTDGVLEESHIIPKFVFRYLKKTAFGNMRSSENPNLIMQDSEKHYMLCGNCEDKFSLAEMEFSKSIFYPFQNHNKNNFQYDKWLYYFITSVNWRCLYYRLADFIRDESLELDELEFYLKNEKIMRDFLLDNINSLNNIENHILFLEDIKEAGAAYKGKKPHVTFRRSQCCNTYFYPDINEYATYANLAGIIIISMFSKSKDALWENTEIFNGEGYISSSNQK